MAGSASNIQTEIEKWDLGNITSTSIPNGCLLNLFVQHKSLVVVRKVVESRFGLDLDDSLFRSHFSVVKKAYDNIKKRVRNATLWDEFLNLLRTEWTVTSKRADIPKRLNDLPTSGGDSLPPTPVKKLRSDCLKCPIHEDTINKLRNDLTKCKAEEEIKLCEMEKELDEVRKLKDETVDEAKKWKRAAERRTGTIKKIRVMKNSVLAKLKLRLRDPMDLARQLKNERIKITAQQKSIGRLSHDVERLESEVRALKKEVASWEGYAEDIICSAGVLEGDDLDEDKRRPAVYNYKLRKVLYETLQSKVPLRHAGDVVNSSVKELTPTKSIRIPSQTTISRMVYEISALSTLQATETLLRCDTATLCWDATSIDSQHVNEVHVETPDKTFTLSIAALPGGSAVDYVLHVTQTVDKMAQLYGKYTGQDLISVKDKIIAKVRSTKSDRCPVNSVVTRQLREFWARDLVELHCNLHPLDGFSKTICGELKKLDVTMGMPNTGRDCCASNFLYTLSKIRNKATGDPAGFTTFLQKNNISPSEIPRYVGNRWNLLFSMAFTIVKRQTLLEDYLDRFCKREEMRKDLLWGIRDSRLLSQFRALALVGEIITGPWMSLFYSNKDRLSNLEMVPHLKTFAEELDSFFNDPTSLLKTTTDVFRQPLNFSIVLVDLQATPQDDIFKSYLTVMLRAIQKVTTNQLARYVTGELSVVTPDMLKATQASTPHNVWAERVLGTFDNLWRRGKQSTVSHVEAKVQCTTNRTLAWLNEHDDCEQQGLVKFAVKMGGELRRQEIERRRWLRREAEQRLVEVGRRRDGKKRRGLEKEIAEVMKREDVGGMRKFEEFMKLDDYVKEKVSLIVKKTPIKGMKFVHDWDEEDGSTETYHGTVLSQTKRAGGSLLSYRIEYVLPAFEENTSVCPLLAEKFVCDLLLGDLRLSM